MTRSPYLLLAVAAQMATCMPSSAQVTGLPVQSPIDLQQFRGAAWLDSISVGTPPAAWMNVPIELLELHPSVTNLRVECYVHGSRNAVIAYGAVEGEVPPSGDFTGRVDVAVYLFTDVPIPDLYGAEYTCFPLLINDAGHECLSPIEHGNEIQCTSRSDRPRSSTSGSWGEHIGVTGRLPDPRGSPPGSTP